MLMPGTFLHVQFFIHFYHTVNKLNTFYPPNPFINHQNATSTNFCYLSSSRGSYSMSVSSSYSTQDTFDSFQVLFESSCNPDLYISSSSNFQSFFQSLVQFSQIPNLSQNSHNFILFLRTCSNTLKFFPFSDQSLWLSFKAQIISQIQPILHGSLPDLLAANLAIKFLFDLIVLLSSSSFSSAETKKDAQDLLFSWLLLLKNVRLKSSSIVLLLNLSVSAVRACPSLIPMVLPALLEMHEGNSTRLTSENFSSLQIRSIQFALKMKLVNFSKDSHVSPQIIPFIDEALIELGVGKSAVLSKSLSRRKIAAAAAAAQAKLRKAKEEELEEEEAAASKKQNQLEQDESVSVDASYIPLPWVVEVILNSLVSNSVQTIQTKLTNDWKLVASNSLTGGSCAGNKGKRDPRLVQKQPQAQPISEPTPVIPDTSTTTTTSHQFDSNSLIDFIFKRLLSAEGEVSRFGFRDTWASLLTKLTLFFSKETLRSSFFEFLLQDFQSRIDLAIFWLHQQWITDYYQHHQTNSQLSSSSSYSQLFEEFLQKLLQSNNPTSLPLFLAQVPDLLDYQLILGVLNELVTTTDQNQQPDDQKIELAFTTATKLAKNRPASRPVILDWFCKFLTYDADQKIRRTAISTCLRENLGTDRRIFRFAVDSFTSWFSTQQCSEAPPPDADLEDLLQKILPLESIRVFHPLVKTQPFYLQYFSNVEFFFELASLSCGSSELLDHVLGVYERCSHQLRWFLRDSLAEKLVASFAQLCSSRAAVSPSMFEYPLSSVLIRMMVTMQDHHPANQTVCEKILHRFIASSAIEEDFLQCSLHSLLLLVPAMRYYTGGESRVQLLLPYVCVLISRLNEHSNQSARAASLVQVSQEVVSHLVMVQASSIPAGLHVDPIEFVVWIHRNSRQLPLKVCIDSIQTCLSLTGSFGPDVWTGVLLKLLDEANLPILYMRTLIQATSLYRQSLTGLALNVLSRLIQRKIWGEHQQQSHWEGFVRCTKLLIPASLSVLLQLPLVPFKDLLNKSPELSTPIQEYIDQQPPSLQHRLTAYVQILKQKK